MGETKHSHRPLIVFLGLVVVFASFSYVLIFTAGNDGDRTGGFALLQFSPAISALVTKLIYQRNVRGLGWGWGKTRYQLAAVLLPLVLGEAQGERGEDRISFAALGLPLFPDATVQAAVNDGEWTYARNIELDPDETEFLYDRQIDPSEDVNLIGREPEQTKRLQAMFRAHREVPATQNVLKSKVSIDPGIAERLKAMGYIE